MKNKMKKLEEKLKLLSVDSQRKATPEFIRLCFRAIKVPKVRRSDTLIFGEFASRFVDFFLVNVVFTLKDDVLMLREGLILLITFLSDPPVNTMDHSDLSFCQNNIHAVLDQASHTICLFVLVETNMDFARGKTILDDLQKFIDEVRGNIERLYIQIPHSSLSNFPRINGLGYFESLLVYLENLKDTMNENKKLVPFLRHQIFTIKEELMPLRPFLQEIWNMQNEHEEVKDVWEQIISLSYQTDLAIKSSFFIDHPIWYNLTCLSFIVEKIQDILSKVLRIKDSPLMSSADDNGKRQMSNSSSGLGGYSPRKRKGEAAPFSTNHSPERRDHVDDTVPVISGLQSGQGVLVGPIITSHYNSSSQLHSIDSFQMTHETCRTSTSTVGDEVVVGFKQETEALIERLTRGTVHLDIVSIVGIGGIGKTTLAKKLFNEPSIRYHFHKRAFCRVSQEYIKRNVLLHILSDLCTIDDEVCQMSDDDLAHMLKKRLSGCTYLVVMDDIWDINAWNDVRASFPDNNKGSRVIFTTQISSISLIDKPNSSPCLLPFLSVDESWELLKHKIFHKDPCPLHLCKVGKLIAEKCQGLPLAIIVIAGVLTRTERSLSHWNEVADALTSFASSEGCKDVMKLSYNQLPEALKSCFLYLGVFHEEKDLEVKRLAMLWVAEGFVLKSGSNCCLRKVAKHYLKELVDRNLVDVLRKSCNGGIKLFRVRDLIRDFCRTKAQEQHYLCFANAINSKLSNQYRVCIEDEWRSFVDAKPRGPTVHSLLYFSKDYHKENCLETFLCNFKILRVLDLRTVEIVGEFPIVVTTLVHLRYLALRFAERGKSNTLNIPSEISNLWNLETLLLLPSRSLKVQLPKDIWKMKRLKHVETGHEAHIELDDVSGVLSQLPDLESFTTLYIPPGKDGEELLRRISNVQKLSCRFNGCNQIPKLDILRNLESLHMKYSGEGFCYPHTFTYPLTIRKLTLESFHIRWNELSALIQKLPRLQVLVLRGILSSDYDAKIWDVQDEEFPNIRSLTLEALDIKEWKASIDSFPCIEKLDLSSCKDLIHVPSCFGEVLTLKSIMVRYCNKGVADSTIQIQKDQLDLGNQINLEVLTKWTDAESTQVC